ncbi:MAG: four helix bundle protein [Sedimentisphaerales bacterium]|nr:four helix bundle protein [Sedimentisphaerales bacterium]
MSKNEEKHEERDIQERAFLFACRIVRLYEFIAKGRGSGEVLGRQVLRSGTSIGANLEEATAAQSKADFVSKCNIALKEARETYYWLRLLIKAGVVLPDKLNELAEESNELVAILTTIVKKSRLASTLRSQKRSSRK